MEEIAPGLFDWTAFHDGIGAQVHSHYALEAATLMDPMVPPEGLEWFERRGAPPARIVLTNRHHHRQSDRFVERFGCAVLCHEAGLHEFAGSGREVEGFAFGDELAPGVAAYEVGALTPEETALHITAGAGALAFADGLVRGRHGELGFVGPGLMGEDPDGVRAGLRAALGRLAAELEFDSLLFAHGEPVRAGARSALRAFLEAPTAGGPPGQGFVAGRLAGVADPPGGAPAAAGQGGSQRYATAAEAARCAQAFDRKDTQDIGKHPLLALFPCD